MCSHFNICWVQAPSCSFMLRQCFKKIAAILYLVEIQRKINCSHRLSIIGPEEKEQEVEAHYTILFGDGDCVKVQNKVISFFCVNICSSLIFSLWFTVKA